MKVEEWVENVRFFIKKQCWFIYAWRIWDKNWERHWDYTIVKSVEEGKKILSALCNESDIDIYSLS